ncbi:centromere protein F-like [Protopterus annectens]|uniref:centromere protein F-like n=1 Tax=Protopterus annectens TaxID=7888 RepID=UPI001CFBD95F|nr:centromere protein F-like [Protopterus annectens]
MGSPAAPAYANTVMAWWETEQMPLLSNKFNIIFYSRFIDDLIFMIEGNNETVDAFFNDINLSSNYLKFTKGNIGLNINFLDVCFWGYDEKLVIDSGNEIYNKHQTNYPAILNKLQIDIVNKVKSSSIDPGLVCSLAMNTDASRIKAVLEKNWRIIQGNHDILEVEAAQQEKLFKHLEEQHAKGSARLNQELERSKKEYVAVQTSLDKLIAEKQCSDKELDELKRKLQSAEKKVETCLRKEKELNKNLQETIEENKKLTTDCKEWNIKVSYLEEELKKATEELKTTCLLLASGNKQDEMPCTTVSTPENLNGTKELQTGCEMHSKHNSSHTDATFKIQAGELKEVPSTEDKLESVKSEALKYEGDSSTCELESLEVANHPKSKKLVTDQKQIEIQNLQKTEVHQMLSECNILAHLSEPAHEQCQKKGNAESKTNLAESRIHYPQNAKTITEMLETDSKPLESKEAKRTEEYEGVFMLQNKLNEDYLICSTGNENNDSVRGSLKHLDKGIQVCSGKLFVEHQMDLLNELQKRCELLTSEKNKADERAAEFQSRLESMQAKVNVQAQQLTPAYEEQSPNLLSNLEEKGVFIEKMGGILKSTLLDLLHLQLNNNDLKSKLCEVLKEENMRVVEGIFQTNIEDYALFSNAVAFASDSKQDNKCCTQAAPAAREGINYLENTDENTFFLSEVGAENKYVQINSMADGDVSMIKGNNNQKPEKSNVVKGTVNRDRFQMHPKSTLQGDHVKERIEYDWQNPRDLSYLVESAKSEKESSERATSIGYYGFIQNMSDSEEYFDCISELEKSQGDGKASKELNWKADDRHQEVESLEMGESCTSLPDRERLILQLLQLKKSTAGLQLDNENLKVQLAEKEAVLHEQAKKATNLETPVEKLCQRKKGVSEELAINSEKERLSKDRSSVHRIFQDLSDKTLEAENTAFQYTLEGLKGSNKEPGVSASQNQLAELKKMISQLCDEKTSLQNELEHWKFKHSYRENSTACYSKHQIKHPKEEEQSHSLQSRGLPKSSFAKGEVTVSQLTEEQKAVKTELEAQKKKSTKNSNSYADLLKNYNRLKDTNRILQQRVTDLSQNKVSNLTDKEKQLLHSPDIVLSDKTDKQLKGIDRENMQSPNLEASSEDEHQERQQNWMDDREDGQKLSYPTIRAEIQPRTLDQLQQEVDSLREQLRLKCLEVDLNFEKYSRLQEQYKKLEGTSGFVVEEDKRIRNVETQTDREKDFRLPENGSTLENKKPWILTEEPAKIAARIEKTRNQVSVAYDDNEYEPYGLPEVVMKGFADIPSGPHCPHVLRRGLLGTTVICNKQRSSMQKSNKASASTKPAYDSSIL